MLPITGYGILKSPRDAIRRLSSISLKKQNAGCEYCEVI